MISNKNRQFYKISDAFHAFGLITNWFQCSEMEIYAVLISSHVYKTDVYENRSVVVIIVFIVEAKCFNVNLWNVPPHLLNKKQ